MSTDESTNTKNKTRPPRYTKRKFWTFRRGLLAFILLLVGTVGLTALIPVTRWVEGGGEVMTDEEAELRPSVEGVVIEKSFRDGHTVNAGDVVIQLNDSEQKLAWEEAKQELKGNRARLARLLSDQELYRSRRKQKIFQAQRRLDLVKQKYEKMKDASTGVFSKQEIQQTRMEMDVAQSHLEELKLSEIELMERRVEVLRQDIEANQKRVKRLEAQMQLRRIVSPIDGGVYFNRFEIGEVVKPDHVLGHVFNRGKWLVRLKIPERSLRYVRIGQSVRVELSAWPAFRYGYLDAKVTDIVPIVTPRAAGDGMFYVEAVIPDPPADRTLQPGMTAQAEIDTGETSWLLRFIGW